MEVKKLYLKIFLLFMLGSCIKETTCVSDFYWENKSGVDVQFIEHKGKVKSSITIKNGEEYNKTASSMGSPYSPFVCDSIELVFDSSKRLMYNWNNQSLRNPLLLESYSFKEISSKKHYSHSEYRYSITEQDYKITGK